LTYDLINDKIIKMNRYKTVAREGRGEYEDSKSVFQSYAASVETQAEAAAYIENVKAVGQCRHNVYAYALKDGCRKCYDDGEPARTAGAPALDAILHSGVSDVVVVVKRYFGGTLLGRGGLIRAYAKAASLALEDAGTAEFVLCDILSADVGYKTYNALAAELPKRGVIIDGARFDENVSLILKMPVLDVDNVEKLSAMIYNIKNKETKNEKISIVRVDRRFCAVSDGLL